MNKADCHQIGGKVRFEEGEELVSEISVLWSVAEIQSVAVAGGEAAEGVPAVGSRALHLIQ
jgi:hypothetical protein